MESLLYEGYALYPYTPGATKNATPTPFGIVYPPAYARRGDSTFDQLRMECLLEAARRRRAEGRAALSAAERAAPPGGRAPRGASAASLDVLLAGEQERRFSFDCEDDEPLELRLALSAVRLDDGRVRLALVAENRSAVARRASTGRARCAGRSCRRTRSCACRKAASSRRSSGAACTSVNTWPVLASAEDDVLLGAAIVLPDHPQLAPESLGNLFDSTEIEEALLLHVQTLTDEERASIEADDPVVNEMIERAAATTPEELLSLHGRVTVRDPVTTEPPTPSADVRDPSAGEREAEVDGRIFRRGGKVVIRPGPDADLHARMLDGRSATIERIFIEYDGKVHLAVTVDDDPGQDLMRETGRFLFFFAPEVEVIA